MTTREGRNSRLVAEVAAMAAENGELWAQIVELQELRRKLEKEVEFLRAERDAPREESSG